VLDAGATSFGRPYFVMELVHGIKITTYCDQANLPTAERLRLFITVCHAVQHAHQKGIIHRDLKPSNILVTLHDGVPVPKVIDFGVAKATQQQRLTDLTVYTQFEQMIGTPLYMSPEQAEMSGLDIDTRSDIYSLGVLLYELLVGHTPFNPETLMKAGFDEMRRVIREQEPQKPSTFVGTMAVHLQTDLAKHRQTDCTKLVGQIRGDLDWIVIKALEKDRSRRYETANGLAKDIERHLASEPVQARPPGAGYRFSRLIKRNKVAFIAGASIAAALLAGSAISLWQAVRARQEADRAQHESERANTALADLQKSAPAFAVMARGLAAQERFDEAIERFDTAIELRPDVAEYVLAKADLLESQFRFAEAAAAYRQAFGLNTSERRAESNVTLCEKLAKEFAANSNLSRESLLELFDTMKNEQRSAAEMLRAGRLLGEENKLLLSYWLDRLKDLPIPPDQPLKSRLVMGEGGRLELDLSQTSVAALAPLKGMPIERLTLSGCKNIRDLSPLRGLRLKELNLGGTVISNLEPLRGMPLESLDLSETLVSDLEPLTGMRLKRLQLNHAERMKELAPLRGMPLSRLECSSTQVVDFSPLVGAPLETLTMAGSTATDLSFLQRLPLKSLDIDNCRNLRGLHVLFDIKTLEFLRMTSALKDYPIPEIVAVASLQALPNLKSVRFGQGTAGTIRSNAEFWTEVDRILRFREALAKVTSGAEGRPFFDRQIDGTWWISFEGLPVRNIASLKGFPISYLNLQFTKVSDLSPIYGMPLKTLLLTDQNITDLQFLTEFELESLWLGSRSRPGLDLAPLARIETLTNILLPPEPRNLEALKKLPRLERISFSWDPALRDVAQTADEFWKQVESAEKTPAEK
jgi:tetratricopeptide (TPR) repeat protein